LDLFILICSAFLAGLIDSMVGGGGLIQLPAVLLTFPTTPHPLLFGTNKFAACLGTAAAAHGFVKRIAIPWSSVIGAAASAFICSFLGARLVSLLDPALLRPVVLILMVGVALYTYYKPDVGVIAGPQLSPSARHIAGVLLGGAIGFYDGFFGPGTGSFLLFGFVIVFRFDFLTASVCSKIVNLGTNAAALIYFIPTQNVWYAVAIPMAAANIAGSVLGVRLAVGKGVRFVRVVFLAVVGVLIIKLSLPMFLER
jgi:uncharacterized membrane protein YfcA